MTCASCRAVGPEGAAWCPKCYLPYAPIAPAGRHRPIVAKPAKKRASWSMRGLCVVVAVLAGFGLFVGVRRGLNCEHSAIHPDVKPLDAAVHQDLAVVQKLANAPKSKGWTLAQGHAVLVADATMSTTLTALRLSPEDRIVVTTWLAHVHSFDAALSTYMADPSDANHKLFGDGAVDLQQGADDLSTGLAAIPKRCRLS